MNGSIDSGAARVGVAVGFATVVLVGFGSPALAQKNPSDSVRDAHRGLQIATMSSLLVTGTLGTLVAINQPTLFNDGLCAKGKPIFGEYGCHGLNVVHGVSALVSLILYTATTTMEFTAFDWPGAHAHNRGYKAASAIHLAGMAILPFAGLVAAVPALLGIQTDNASTFERVMRTLHLSVGYLTIGTYVATAAIDLR